MSTDQLNSNMTDFEDGGSLLEEFGVGVRIIEWLWGNISRKINAIL